MDKMEISNAFKAFSEKECKNSSPLYEFLSLEISKDDEMLELSSYAQAGQPIPNLFLGAVHYLLLKGKKHPLTEYYPSIMENPKEINQSFTYFKDFCHLYREKIITILQIKLVQTNEVRRCAYLFPSFIYIYKQVKKPLALIEIGTSAGLQLLWDQYSYTYNTAEILGNINSSVHIQSEIRGGNIPYLSQTSPPVTHRTGLDLHINDVADPENKLWLLSLIWPEHEERRNLFKQAADCVIGYELDLIEGNGVELLPQIAKEVSIESTLCVFHTHVANQIPVDMKQELLDNVKEIGQSRDIFHLYNNMWDGDLHLDSYLNGKEYNQVVAQTDAHGRWFTWNLPKHKTSQPLDC